MTVDNVSFFYRCGEPLFHDFTLHLDKNRIYSVVGPSGCGKTTLFKLLVGIEYPKQGSIAYDDGDQYAIMMQTDTLLPWYTVKDNICLGYELARKGQRVCEPLIADYLSAFNLENVMDSFPSELSTGMKQRVQMIQAMVGDTAYLLMDEPFSNLDYDVKLHIQQILKRHHQQTKNTLVIITHDIEDAIAMSDEIIVLSAKPTSVVANISVEIDNSDPVAVRTNPQMADYFTQIWSLLKSTL